MKFFEQKYAFFKRNISDRKMYNFGSCTDFYSHTPFYLRTNFIRTIFKGMSKIWDLIRFRKRTPSFGKNLLILIKIDILSTKLLKILFKTIFKSSIDKGLCTPVPSIKV